MRHRHYHIHLDVQPTWGQVTGFGLDSREMEWIQPADWWQLMLMAFGGVLTVNGVPVPFPPQSLLIVPPSARCRVERANGDSLAQHWLKFRPNPEGKLLMAVPQVKRLDADYAFHELQFRACLDFLPFSRSRLDVMAWNLLWTVAGNAAIVPEDPVVAQVEHQMKADLARPLTQEGLARAAGVSVSKLTRLFLEHRGQSPSEYIRTLRMQQACALLVNTGRPIKEIAVRVGYPDLQRFNKVVRETFGCSPRTLRAERPELTLYVMAAEDKYRINSLLEAEPPAHFDPDFWDQASS